METEEATASLIDVKNERQTSVIESMGGLQEVVESSSEDESSDSSDPPEASELQGVDRPSSAEQECTESQIERANETNETTDATPSPEADALLTNPTAVAPVAATPSDATLLSGSRLEYDSGDQHVAVKSVADASRTEPVTPQPALATKPAKSPRSPSLPSTPMAATPDTPLLVAKPVSTAPPVSAAAVPEEAGLIRVGDTTYRPTTIGGRDGCFVVVGHDDDPSYAFATRTSPDGVTTFVNIGSRTKVAALPDLVAVPTPVALAPHRFVGASRYALRLLPADWAELGAAAGQPNDQVYVPVHDDEPVQPVLTDIGGVATAPVGLPSGTSLADVWVAKLDRVSGRFYFTNAGSKDKVWVLPDAVPLVIRVERLLATHSPAHVAMAETLLSEVQSGLGIVPGAQAGARNAMEGDTSARNTPRSGTPRSGSAKVVDDSDEAVVMRTLEQRFGPEPWRLRRHQRERLIALYSRFDPAQLPHVGEMLLAATGSAVDGHDGAGAASGEDRVSPDQLRTLAANVDRVVSEVVEVHRRRLARVTNGGMAAEAFEAAEPPTFRQRAANIYAFYLPEKTPQEHDAMADEGLRLYDGLELQMIASLVQRFGAEPVVKPLNAVTMSEMVDPLKAVGQACRTTELVTRQPLTAAAQQSVVRRAQRMYLKYNRPKTETVAVAMEAYKSSGSADILVELLVRKYGAEPAADENLDAVTSEVGSNCGRASETPRQVVPPVALVSLAGVTPASDVSPAPAPALGLTSPRRMPPREGVLPYTGAAATGSSMSLSAFGARLGGAPIPHPGGPGGVTATMPGATLGDGLMGAQTIRDLAHTSSLLRQHPLAQSGRHPSMSAPSAAPTMARPGPATGSPLRRSRSHMSFDQGPAVDPEYVSRYRAVRRRVESLYMQYCPAKATEAFIDRTIMMYRDDEDTLLESLVQRYGPEPGFPMHFEPRTNAEARLPEEQQLALLEQQQEAFARRIEDEAAMDQALFPPPAPAAAELVRLLGSDAAGDRLFAAVMLRRAALGEVPLLESDMDMPGGVASSAALESTQPTDGQQQALGQPRFSAVRAVTAAVSEGAAGALARLAETAVVTEEHHDAPDLESEERDAEEAARAAAGALLALSDSDAPHARFSDTIVASPDLLHVPVTQVQDAFAELAVDHFGFPSIGSALRAAAKFGAAPAVLLRAACVWHGVTLPFAPPNPARPPRLPPLRGSRSPQLTPHTGTPRAGTPLTATADQLQQRGAMQQQPEGGSRCVSLQEPQQRAPLSLPPAASVGSEAPTALSSTKAGRVLPELTPNPTSQVQSVLPAPEPSLPAGSLEAPVSESARRGSVHSRREPSIAGPSALTPASAPAAPLSAPAGSVAAPAGSVAGTSVPATPMQQPTAGVQQQTSPARGDSLQGTPAGDCRRSVSAVAGGAEEVSRSATPGAISALSGVTGATGALTLDARGLRNTGLSAVQVAVAAPRSVSALSTHGPGGLPPHVVGLLDPSRGGGGGGGGGGASAAVHAAEQTSDVHVQRWEEKRYVEEREKELMATLADYEARLREAFDNLDTANREAEAVRDEKRRLLDELEEVRRAAERERAPLEAQLSELRDEAAREERRVAADRLLLEEAVEAERVDARRLVTEERVRADEARLAHLEELRGMQEELGQSQVKKTEAERHAANLERRLRSLETGNEQLERRIGELSGQLTETQMEAARRLSEAHDASVATDRAASSATDAKLANAEDQAAAASAAAEQWRLAVIALEARLVAANQESERQQAASADENDTAARVVASLRRANRTLEDRVATLTSRLRNVQLRALREEVTGVAAAAVPSSVVSPRSARAASPSASRKVPPLGFAHTAADVQAAAASVSAEGPLSGSECPLGLQSPPRSGQPADAPEMQARLAEATALVRQQRDEISELRGLLAHHRSAPQRFREPSVSASRNLAFGSTSARW